MSFTPTKVSDDFSSSPQLMLEDIPQVAAQGYKTILNCRPDGEAGAEQPSSAQLKAAAEQLGLTYFHFPVAMGTAGAEHAAAAAKVLAAAPKPVLGFCRSGTRATKLYQAASGAPVKQGVIQWLKSKCLITRLWRWCKSRQSGQQCCK